jgi:hypothetical protein
VSTFSPSQPQYQPDLSRVDELAESAANAMSRPLNPWLGWSWGRTLVVGLLTGGIGLRLLCEQERQQLWQVAEWLRLRDDTGEARAVADTARELRVPAVPRVALYVALAIAALAAIWFFRATPGTPSMETVLDLAYRYNDRMARLDAPGRVVVASRYVASTDVAIAATALAPRAPTPFGLSRQELAFAYLAGLSAAYLSMLWMLNSHAANVNRFVDALNVYLDSKRLGEVSPLGLQLGLGPLWIVTGLMMIGGGVPWGLPMMLAAGAQRRYIKAGAGSTRWQIAGALRAAIGRVTPDALVRTPSFNRRLCRNPLCRAALPQAARFCGRCGTPATAMVDRLA